jgi:hypothetical protein
MRAGAGSQDVAVTCTLKISATGRDAIQDVQCWLPDSNGQIYLTEQGRQFAIAATSRVHLLHSDGIAHGSLDVDSIALVNKEYYDNVALLAGHQPATRWPAQGTCFMRSAVQQASTDHTCATSSEQHYHVYITNFGRSACLLRNTVSRASSRDALTRGTRKFKNGFQSVDSGSLQSSLEEVDSGVFQERCLADIRGIGKILIEAFSAQGSNNLEQVEAAIQSQCPKNVLGALLGDRVARTPFLGQHSHEGAWMDPGWTRLIDFLLLVYSESPTTTHLMAHPLLQEPVFSDDEIRQLVSEDGMLSKAEDVAVMVKGRFQTVCLPATSLRWSKETGLRLHICQDVEENDACALYGGVPSHGTQGSGSEMTYGDSNPYSRHIASLNNNGRHLDSEISIQWPLRRYVQKNYRGGFINSSLCAPNLSHPGWAPWAKADDILSEPKVEDPCCVMYASRRITAGEELLWDYPSTDCDLSYPELFRN